MPFLFTSWTFLKKQDVKFYKTQFPITALFKLFDFAFSVGIDPFGLDTSTNDPIKIS